MNVNKRRLRAGALENMNIKTWSPLILSWLHVFCGLALRLPGTGSKFVAEFPAKMVLKGNLMLSVDIFPRQGRIRGLSDNFLWNGS